MKWWITFMMICFGLVLAVVTGLISTVNEADMTKLSFLILGIFMYFSIRVGMKLRSRENIAAFLARGKFVASVLERIGIIGTVLGFIIMLSVSFGSVEVANTASLRCALQHMGVGMSTALYTTAAGLICSVLLRLQLRFLEEDHV